MKAIEKFLGVDGTLNHLSSKRRVKKAKATLRKSLSIDSTKSI